MSPRTPFRRIDVAEAKGLLERSDLLVLDARDAGSFEKSHVNGAQRISSANLSAVVGGTAKARPILIYCYHGNASREYAQIFSDFGFGEVYSLDGGYEAWRSQRRRAEAARLTLHWRNGWLRTFFPPPAESTPSSPMRQHRS